MRWIVLTLLVSAVVLVSTGCRTGRNLNHKSPTPAQSGLNSNNLIDPFAQWDADDLGNPKDWYAAAERLRRRPTPEQIANRKSVLCLSGGGSHGAFTAGVLYGWSEFGDRPGTNGRPNFEVVTGISTGALIAPMVFLGPRYDRAVKRFYTTVDTDDVYRLRPIRGLFSTALADNAPLGRLISGMVTDEMIDEIACEHRKGRRLYIGTTELESERFVFWDIGEIANRGRAGDRELVCQILLGSSAIPGFFPPSRISVTVDGKRYSELHGDGSVTQSIFFRPPHVPPEQRTEATRDLAGTDLYMIVAGKVFNDARPVKNRSIEIAGSSVSSILFSQTRGDLARMYLLSMINGMSYHLCAIPGDFPVSMPSTTFERRGMNQLFDEGYQLGRTGSGWRQTPPGVEEGESMLKRGGTDLIHQPRGPGLVIPKKGQPIDPLTERRLPMTVSPELSIK